MSSELPAKGKKNGPWCIACLIIYSCPVTTGFGYGDTYCSSWLPGLCGDYTKRAVPPQNILYINVIGTDFFTEMKVLETLLRPLMTKYRSTYKVRSCLSFSYNVSPVHRISRQHNSRGPERIHSNLGWRFEYTPWWQFTKSWHVQKGVPMVASKE